MRHIAAILASFTLAAPALAGGLTTPEPEPTVIAQPTPVYAPSADWTGFYVGGQFGYGDVGSNGALLDGHGTLGGVHAGYRWDFGQYVAGAELDYDKADISLGAAGDTLDSVARLKLIGGADLGKTLIYGTVGAARADATVGGVGLTDTGYFLGAGMDYAITDQWSLGGELLQHKFDNFDGSGVNLDATTVNARVSFKF